MSQPLRLKFVICDPPCETCGVECVCDTLKLISCSLCGTACISDTLRWLNVSTLPPAYQTIPRIVVRLHGQPRCQACVDAGYKRACEDSDAAAKAPYTVREVRVSWRDLRG